MGGPGRGPGPRNPLKSQTRGDSMNRRSKPRSYSLLALAVLFFVPGVAFAKAYSPSGADTCLGCHKSGPLGVAPAFGTVHGSKGNPASPAAGLQCESCHGPSNDHIAGLMQGKKVKPARTFREDDEASAAEQNEACLGCHGGHEGWFGSAHERTDVACAVCHSIHVESDPVFDAATQQETCFGCHPRKRSDIHKTSGHPLRFGKMTCSDCHDVHDGNVEFLLVSDTVNENCYGCHAEKRGPFLWEHAPVTEDCTLCHRPHGSNHPALLARRPPLLCQQCHSAVGHPGVAFTGDDMEDEGASRFLLARSCMNCHSQVHGSNHPSGASQIR